MQNITVPGSSINSHSNVIYSCNCTGSQLQGMDISELEFVQIIIIIVVMTVMVVVIVCLLNHYRLSALAFLARHSQTRTPDQATQQDGRVWPAGSLVVQQGTPEVMCGPRAHQERFNASSFTQRDRFCRFQPTHPFLQQQIQLPPTICLSDGEELPPYTGPCTLQLRDPEQQLELSRASVRAPPNRTVFDSDLVHVYVHGNAGPQPPSSSSVWPVEGPPPSYSEVMGHYSGSSAFHSQYSNNTPSPGQPWPGGNHGNSPSRTALQSFSKTNNSLHNSPV